MIDISIISPNTKAAPRSSSPEFAIALTDVSVRFKMPTEDIRTLKESALRLLQGKRTGYRELLALDSINLTVNQGEILGIIGRNGAGKSTLLKVIARIMTPSSGRVQIRGTIAPLIELGTGFHPELTGRENIFLNGAMLGYTRREVQAKLDEIIDFSELERFIDAPIRTYSSGMTIRLGFSIASAVDPDILIVDEVLAVGDMAFQKKCLNRMEAFRKSGKTILFVSHSLGSVRDFCSSAVWLEKGKIRMVGDVEDVAAAYRTAETGAAPTDTEAPRKIHTALQGIFADVPSEMSVENRWMAHWIEQLYLNGLTTGCADNPLRFCPEQLATRQHVAGQLLRARQWPQPLALDAPSIMAKLREERIIVPDRNGNDNPLPDTPVTRGEMAAFLLKAKYGADYVPPPAENIFADLPDQLPEAQRWLIPWIEQVYREDISMGCNHKPLRFCPQRYLIRAELAVMVLRTFNRLPKPQ